MRYVINDKPQTKLYRMRDSGEVKDWTHFRTYIQSIVFIARLSINSLRNKFELFTEKTKRDVDVLLISATIFPKYSTAVNSKLQQKKDAKLFKEDLLVAVGEEGEVHWTSVVMFLWFFHIY